MPFRCPDHLARDRHALLESERVAVVLDLPGVAVAAAAEPGARSADGVFPRRP